MPTAFTDPVEKGEMTELRDYALRCAHGMSMMVHARDDDLGSKLRHHSVTWHYYEDVKKYDEILARLMLLSDGAKTQGMVIANAELQATHESIRSSNKVTKGRYEAMDKKVTDWPCPLDYQGLKQFMSSQIQLCTRHYAESSLYQPKPYESASEWWQHEVVSARRRLAEAHKDLADEIERAAEVNKWIDGLHKLFEVEDGSTGYMSCSVDDPITCLKCGKTIDLSEVDAHRCQKRKEN